MVRRPGATSLSPSSARTMHLTLRRPPLLGSPPWGASVSDDVMARLISERVQRSDCRRHGWVLEGFPETEAQAIALHAEGTHVRDCLLLDLDVERAIAAAAARRFDPATGAVYDTRALPEGTSDELRRRLVAHPKDHVHCNPAWEGQKNSLRSLCARPQSKQASIAASDPPRIPPRRAATGRERASLIARTTTKTGSTSALRHSSSARRSEISFNRTNDRSGRPRMQSPRLVGLAPPWRSRSSSGAGLP